MTPQGEATKQQILTLFCGSGYGDVDCDTATELKLEEILKSHLTSEVNLAIEQVEKWAENKGIPTPNFATNHEDDIWENGYTSALSDLLSFLTTLKK